MLEHCDHYRGSLDQSILHPLCILFKESDRPMSELLQKQIIMERSDMSLDKQLQIIHSFFHTAQFKTPWFYKYCTYFIYTNADQLNLLLVTKCLKRLKLENSTYFVPIKEQIRTKLLTCPKEWPIFAECYVQAERALYFKDEVLNEVMLKFLQEQHSEEMQTNDLILLLGALVTLKAAGSSEVDGEICDVLSKFVDKVEYSGMSKYVLNRLSFSLNTKAIMPVMPPKVTAYFTKEMNDQNLIGSCYGELLLNLTSICSKLQIKSPILMNLIQDEDSSTYSR